MSKVLVVGAGVAGIAAAWSARRAGATVTLIDGGAGASALTSGAVDDTPWDDLASAAAALGLADARPSLLTDDVVSFAGELGLWAMPSETRCLLATSAGRLRGARGRDTAILDLAPHPGERIALPRADRANWDADALAATLGDDPRAKALALEFVAIDADVLRFDDERRVGDVDLAARHDDPKRLGWLADRLKFALTRIDADAVLLGPWLGVESPRAERLSELVGAPVGEILTGSGSPAGPRVERARRRLTSHAGVELIKARVTSIADGDGRVRVAMTAPGPRDDKSTDRRARSVESDAVVLAIGGVLGGGILYDPPERRGDGDFPAQGGPAFRLSLDAPGVRLAGHKPLGVTSSMHGPDLDLIAWPRPGAAGALEAVGLHVTRRRGAGHEDRARDAIYAAGDATAHRPRTALEAVASGLRAGAAAARR